MPENAAAPGFVFQHGYFSIVIFSMGRSMSTFDVEDWGLIDFQAAWEQQREIAREVRLGTRRSTLVFCQHPTVITIGRNGTEDNVVVSKEYLASKGVQVVAVDRGGDVTLHNPGQLVGYPIFRLTDFKEDLHWFLRTIEESIIGTLAGFSIVGSRESGLTGVWIEGMRKICAIGIHCSRWVTTHGFALNATNDTDDFSMIIPCGISDRRVTSISEEVNEQIDVSSVQQICVESFRKNFF